jgi:hypothetical protein
MKAMLIPPALSDGRPGHMGFEMANVKGPARELPYCAPRPTAALGQLAAASTGAPRVG